jgi:hypothetical protein
MLGWIMFFLLIAVILIVAYRWLISFWNTF